MKMNLSVGCLWLVLGCLAPLPIWGQEIDVSTEVAKERLAAFQRDFQRQVEEPHRQSIANLRNLYVNALETSLKKASEAGRLDDSLALNEDLKLVTEGVDIPATDKAGIPADLVRARQVWRKEKTTIDAERAKRIAAVRQSHTASLNTLEQTLTKALRLDEAASIRHLREAITQIENPQAKVADSKRNLTREMKWVGAGSAVEQEGIMILKGVPQGAPRLETQASFKPPFTLEVRYIPVEIETRIYYANGMFILGWDSEPNQVVIHHPVSGDAQYFKGLAPRPNKECTLFAEVGTRKITLKLNGRQFYSEVGDFSALESTLAIGPVFGNTTKLISFVVEEGVGE